jgi:hypothetical protein
MKTQTTCDNCGVVFTASDNDSSGSMNCPECDYPASEDIFFKFDWRDYYISKKLVRQIIKEKESK